MQLAAKQHCTYIGNKIVSHRQQLCILAVLFCFCFDAFFPIQVNIVVDQANVHNSYVQDVYNQLTLDDVIYVGGSPSTETLPGTKISNNFIGCIKEVYNIFFSRH